MGSYKLKKKLGGGQMGDIWLAEHEMLARPAAVKLIRYENIVQKWKGDPEDIRATVTERFQQEAQATASLKSNHTVTVFDYGVTDEGTLYYVMELLEGMDFGKLVNDYGPISPERMLHLINQVCHSLAEAHERGLVHRDIKPANIFLCKQGFEVDQVKVLDFGLVTSLKGMHGTENKRNQSSKKEFLGTPFYVSPEQVTSDGNFDHRSDLYSLGCVMYWLVTGRAPFTKPQAVDVLVAHVKEKPVSPNDLLQEMGKAPIPEGVNSLILQCLEKAPKDRPQSAQELSAKIEELLNVHPWKPSSARSWWDKRISTSRS